MESSLRFAFRIILISKTGISRTRQKLARSDIGNRYEALSDQVIFGILKDYFRGKLLFNQHVNSQALLTRQKRSDKTIFCQKKILMKL